jgi:hypothetical protein
MQPAVHAAYGVRRTAYGQGSYCIFMQPSDLSPALLIGRERGLALAGRAGRIQPLLLEWKLPASSPIYGARSIRAGAVGQITRIRDPWYGVRYGVRRRRAAAAAHRESTPSQ